MHKYVYYLILRAPLYVAMHANSHVDLRANFVPTYIHSQPQRHRAAVAFALGLGPTQRHGWPVQLILYGPLPELGLRSVAVLLCGCVAGSAFGFQWQHSLSTPRCGVAL